MGKSKQKICMKIKFRFGMNFHYLHICSTCRDNHPLPGCKLSGYNSVSTPAMSQYHADFSDSNERNSKQYLLYGFVYPLSACRLFDVHVSV